MFMCVLVDQCDLYRFLINMFPRCSKHFVTFTTGQYQDMHTLVEGNNELD